MFKGMKKDEAMLGCFILGYLIGSINTAAILWDYLSGK